MIAAPFRRGENRVMEDARFAFDAYHILLVALGASLLVASWLPHLLVRRPPAATTLLITCGMAGSLLFPDIVAGIDPTENPAIWELAAELVIIVVLCHRIADRRPGRSAAVAADGQAARDHHASHHCRRWFRSLAHARDEISRWRHHYNAERPHSALGYRNQLELLSTITATAPETLAVSALSRNPRPENSSEARP